MTEDQKHAQAVIAIITACTPYPTYISIPALAEALGGLIAAKSKDRAEVNELARTINRGIKAVAFERLA